MKIRLSLCFLFVALVIFIVACYNENETLYRKEFVETSDWAQSSEGVVSEKELTTYILNINSKKIHKVSYGTGDLMLPENRRVYEGEIEDLYRQGYTNCGNCFK